MRDWLNIAILAAINAAWAIGFSLVLGETAWHCMLRFLAGMAFGVVFVECERRPTWLLAPFRFAKAMWRAFQDWRFNRRVFATPEEAARRFAICSFCPFSHDRIGALQCEKCSCFCRAKTGLRSETCPEGRW